jgi:hypothetical protein|tara:strand:+ start:3259 stop:3522 length:264 start_codon:yes stop_codon:yes gene_type:complete
MKEVSFEGNITSCAGSRDFDPRDPCGIDSRLCEIQRGVEPNGGKILKGKLERPSCYIANTDIRTNPSPEQATTTVALTWLTWLVRPE